jgi:hypothetical protein
MNKPNSAENLQPNLKEIYQTEKGSLRPKKEKRRQFTKIRKLIKKQQK